MNNFTHELRAKMAANSGVIHINEEDELRLETKCRQAAAASGYNLFRWTQTDGLVPVSDDIKMDDTKKQELAALVDPVGSAQRPGLLSVVKNWQYGPSVVLAFDMVTLVNRMPTLPIACRLVKDITDKQQQAEATDNGTTERGVCQLVLCDRETLQLDTPTQRMTLELPDRIEMSAILDYVLLSTSDEVAEEANKSRDRILNSLAGLPAYQAGNAISESVVRTGKVDPSLLKEYKKELVSAKGLTWIDTDDRGFDALGGLTPLKSWLTKRASVMMDDDMRRQYGVGAPKGVVCAGVPGAGKSWAARCLASFLGVPLLMLDIGATRGMFQGQSEESFSDALRIAESTPCVLLVDEAEKQLGGATGQGSETDGGTGSRVLGTFLTWMQENDSKVFVYMTANRPTDLPPELLRAGRTSGQFWFSYPTTTERTAIVGVMAARYPKAVTVDSALLVKASEGCTGAEIEASFEEAAITAMVDRRDMTTDDIAAELGKVSRVKDTFTMSPELEAWSSAAQRANDSEEAPNTAKTAPVRRIGRIS